MEVNTGASHICETLQKGEPCLIGRNGTIETQVLSYGADIEDMRKHLELHAGIFPSTKESVSAWIVAYKAALGAIDTEPIVAGWYAPMKVAEERILKQHCLSETYIPLRSLEPYYAKNACRWTALLAGKKVAVVSSFAKTIAAQIPKRDEIWGVHADTILPVATWFPIQTGYSPALAQGRAGWPEGTNTWQDAITYLTAEVMKTGAEVCIIGCGGLGMILGAELKRRGLQCIVLGGATQVLFGIKGRRWATHDVISKFWTDAWVWPSLEETPGGAADIEGGCYWDLATQGIKSQQ
ncbi:MAG: hypothetical protein EBY22_06745 [Gammaproteobacteria bacterium]|nr:hypothetical protein [Gammaproteobacteria bacterium]